MAFKVGDIVFWATASAAGEYAVIGHPKGRPHVLVFEGGGEVDAEDCQPTAGGLRCAPTNIGGAISRNFLARSRAARKAAGCSLAMADCPHEVIGGPSIEREADHFIPCPACGSWLDCRDLGQLLAHEDWCSRDHHTTPMPGHQPS